MSAVTGRTTLLNAVWMRAVTALVLGALLLTAPARAQESGATTPAAATTPTDTASQAATASPATASPATAPPAGVSSRVDLGPDGRLDASDVLSAADRAIPVSPLSPAPVGSPRQTFASFRALAQDAIGALLEAFDVAANDDEILDSREVLRLKQQAIRNLDRAGSTFDLSEVPPVNRATVALRSVLLLEEIMDRIPVPDLTAIPDEAEVEAGDAPNGWTIPGTEIRMVRLKGPDGEPVFLFSSDTVQRLPAFYAEVQDMPQKSADKVDFYQHFVAAPGLSMPVSIYRFVINFPSWLLATYEEQAVWQWIALVVLTALFGGIVYAAVRWERHRVQSLNAVRRSLSRLWLPIAVVILLGLYDRALDDFVNLTGDVLAIEELVVEALQAVALAFIAVFAFNALAAMIITSPRIGQESLDASLIRLVMRVLGLTVAGYIVFVGATRLGVPLYGVIAGLGVGGLAIALAVRPTLENFIGGIILYADRPVKVGDFCKFGDMLGTVEMIGLRSTKIRALDRTQVTVQNADFAQMSITNYTRRDSNLMQSTIGLRYETTPEQLSAIIEALAAMLRADERVDDKTVRVCFRGFGNYALNVEIWAYVRSADWGQFLKIQEDLFLKVMRIVAEEGSAFAIPAQTTYLGTDQPPGRPVGAQVALLSSGEGAGGTGAAVSAVGST